jgi:hypothetical protein
LRKPCTSATSAETFPSTVDHPDTYILWYNVVLKAFLLLRDAVAYEVVLIRPHA